MSTLNHPTVTLDLNLLDDGVESSPNKVRISFTPAVVSEIARALAAIEAMDLGLTEITISFNGNYELFDYDTLWTEVESNASSGAFDVSSAWLKVQAGTVSIEIWDAHGGSELQGSDQISNIPGLADALEAAKSDAYAALRARLS